MRQSLIGAAYGLAVTGTMTLTGIMMTWIFSLRGKIFFCIISSFVTVVDIIFLVSNTYKIPHGGYWSIVLALIPLSLIVIYTSGERRLYAINLMDIDTFLKRYNQAYKTMNKIKGTAIFFHKRDKGYSAVYC